MRHPLGTRDDRRFEELDAAERDYLCFQVDFCLGILEQRPLQAEALNAAATALTQLGYYEDGLKLDERLARLRPEDAMVLYNLACSQALAGKPDDAFATLADAIDRGYGDAEHLLEDPDLETLRGDPRFLTMLKRVQRSAHGHPRKA